MADGELRCIGKGIAVRCENQLFQATAKIGQVYALAWIGEQYLLDQIADVVVLVGRRHASAGVNSQRIVQVVLVHHLVITTCESRLESGGVNGEAGGPLGPVPVG